MPALREQGADAKRQAVRAMLLETFPKCRCGGRTAAMAREVAALQRASGTASADLNACLHHFRL
jgi:hypothetical protein